jgi:O-antigen ligase
VAVTGTSVSQARMATAVLPSPEAATSRLPWPLVIYLAAVILPAQFHIGSLLLTLPRLVLMVGVIPLTIRLFRGQYGRILPTDVLFFLYTLWLPIVLLVNNPDKVIQNAGSTGVEFLGGYLFTRAYIRSAADFTTLCRALAYITCAFLPFAIYETITNQPLILDLIRKIPGLTSDFSVHYPRRLGFARVQAVFPHPILFGVFCSISFSLCLIALKDVLSNTKRYLLTSVIVICTFLSLSSGAVLAIVLQLFLLGWALLLSEFRQRWLILIGLFVAIYVGIDLLSNRTPIRVFMTYATFSSQTAYYRGIINDFGMQNVWANPIFGLGLRDWVRPSYMASPSMDNYWLYVASHMGIPGFLLLASGYGTAMIRIGFRNFDRAPQLFRLRRAWIFTFVGMTLSLVTVDIWATVYSYVYFVFGAGMWMQTVQPGAAPLVAAAPVEHSGRQPFPRLRRNAADPAPIQPRIADTANRAHSARTPHKLTGAGRDGPRLTRFPPPGDRDS